MSQTDPLRLTLRLFPWSPRWGVGKSVRDRFLYLIVVRGLSLQTLAQRAGVPEPNLRKAAAKHGADFDVPGRGKFIFDVCVQIPPEELTHSPITELIHSYGVTRREIENGVARRRIRRPRAALGKPTLRSPRATEGDEADPPS